MSQSSTYNIKVNIEKNNTSLKYIISIEYDKGATLDGEPEKDRVLTSLETQCLWKLGSFINTNGMQLIISNLPKFIINIYLQMQSVYHIQAIFLGRRRDH